MKIDWQPLVEIIQSHDRFLLTSHQRADCDAVGSEMALALILETLGKQVAIVNSDAVPEHIAFMDPYGRVAVIGASAPLEAMRAFEVMIVVDTSAWGQLGGMAEVLRSFKGLKAVIDHHASEDDLGAVVFKDSTAEATGRLILQLAKELGVPITPEIAAPLFAAIATDTGWFRFPSVTADTFAALAKLTAAGASPAKTFSLLYEQHSLSRLHLRGRILDHVTPECGGRMMWTYVTAEDFSACGAQKTDTEDVINMLLTVKGVEIAVLFVELESAVTKVSLRSRSGFDLNQFASQFGGGGHKAASGISFPGTMADAQQAVLAALRNGLEQSLGN